jgi:hypothetical protein
LQQQIVECERALAANDETWKQRCEELSTELTGKERQYGERWAQLIDMHTAEKLQLERSIRADHEEKERRADQARRREVDGLHATLRQFADDLQATAAELARRTADFERVCAELNSIERIDPADFHRLQKSVEAYRVELMQMTENTVRTLEPMATAGRVAMASSRELQIAVAA